MTEITVTPIIKDAVNKVKLLTTCSDNLLQTLENLSTAESISINVLQTVSKLLVDEYDNGKSGHDMESVPSYSSRCACIFRTKPVCAYSLTIYLCA